MAATTAFCTSFKVDLLQGRALFRATSGTAFKIALIISGMSGTYGAASTNYSDITGNSDEVTGTGYTAGGDAITCVVDATSSGTTAYADLPDAQWTSADFTARAAMIYNTDDSNAAASVHDFGADKTASGGNFDITMPTFDSTNAIYRLA
jgi:hypothetical protein